MVKTGVAPPLMGAITRRYRYSVGSAPAAPLAPVSTCHLHIYRAGHHGLERRYGR